MSGVIGRATAGVVEGTRTRAKEYGTDKARAAKSKLEGWWLRPGETLRWYHGIFLVVFLALGLMLGWMGAVLGLILGIGALYFARDGKVLARRREFSSVVQTRG